MTSLERPSPDCRCFDLGLERKPMPKKITVGAVAYDPKVVTIWELINDFFRAREIPNDYVLFSNYEAQVDALLSGAIDIAWNTNLAYVRVHRRTNGLCKVLAMRHTDVA